jgi:hypothetical protein
MKKIILLLTLSYGHLYGQTPIDPYSFTVTITKTSNIVFPFAIKSADVGSRDVLLQKAKGAENILELRAAKENFVPTSLAVITADGKLYPFVVSYEPNPKILNLSFGTLDADASALLGKTRFLLRKTTVMGLQLALHGIYIKESLLWFVFTLSNTTQIPFAPAYIHFAICDRSKAKRTSIQEQSLTPTYIQNIGLINGNASAAFVCAFDLFTLSKNKKLVFTIGETRQERMLSLAINSRALLKAKAAK